MSRLVGSSLTSIPMRQRVGHDPIALLGEVSAERLEELAADQAFVDRAAAADADLTEYLAGQRWYQTLDDRKPRAIAYFSPEYGIAQALPQYSGGPESSRGITSRRHRILVFRSSVGCSTDPDTSGSRCPGWVAAGDVSSARPGWSAAHAAAGSRRFSGTG